MNKLSIQIFIIIEINSRSRFLLNKFTGCEIPLFPNPSNFLIIQIKFEEACKNFETCINTFNTDKETYLKNFEKDQNEFCSSYSNLNLFR